MSGMFLEVAIDNAHFMLPRGIHTLAKGPVGRIDDVHQICTYYRQLGVATLLQEGSADRYDICAMQSAGMYLYELEPQPDGAKVTSFAKPLFDAIGSGYWEAARWIAEASRPTWNPEREYEDDFLYVWFLIQHGVLQAPAEVTEPILERYEEVLDGELDLRLDVCRALLRRHAKDFDTALVGLLERRRRDNGEDAGWVFPTRDASGRVTHVVEAKQQRTVAGRKVPHLPSPHRLRDTFATAAHEAGVHPLDLKVLMNHALPGGDVTLGYVRPSVEHLRGAVERVAGFLLMRMEGGAPRSAPKPPSLPPAAPVALPLKSAASSSPREVKHERRRGLARRPCAPSAQRGAPGSPAHIGPLGRHPRRDVRHGDLTGDGVGDGAQRGAGVRARGRAGSRSGPRP